jgi:6-phosphofructokinase 1
MGVNLDNRALTGVYIGVVMGRHAGFLTAASSLAQRHADDGPHLVYVPERAFDIPTFLTDVDRVVAQHGLCTIAVSEGISDASGTAMITKLNPIEERDDHGNVQLSGTGALGDLLADTIRRELKLKRVRADTLGYLQRCFIGCRSDRDAHEAREVGEKAVQYAMWDNIDGSVVIRRPVLDYGVDYELVPLERVAGKTRHMPDHFINAAGNGVTADFHAYCRPLLGSGVPEAHRLRAPAVPKILNGG